MEKIELENGKYTVYRDEDGLRVDRYNEPWRILTGDKFIYSLVGEVLELKEKLAESKSLIQQIRDCLHTPNKGHPTYFYVKSGRMFSSVIIDKVIPFLERYANVK